MNWLRTLLARGPKARRVVSSFGHVENLARHAPVDLRPIAQHPALHIPIWIDVPPEEATPHTYDGWFWEIEPMGEYLYYLAGDFPKNEKGLLRYASATTRIEVHACFEDDVISVAEHDSAGDAERAARGEAVHADFAGMTVADAARFCRESMDGDRSFITLGGLGGDGVFAWLRLADPHGGMDGVQARCDVIDTASGLPRLIRIDAVSMDAAQEIGPLCDAVIALFHRYSALPPHRLSGAIRM